MGGGERDVSIITACSVSGLKGVSVGGKVGVCTVEQGVQRREDGTAEERQTRWRKTD